MKQHDLTILLALVVESYIDVIVLSISFNDLMVFGWDKMIVYLLCEYELPSKLNVVCDLKIRYVSRYCTNKYLCKLQVVRVYRISDVRYIGNILI